MGSQFPGFSSVLTMISKLPSGSTSKVEDASRYPVGGMPRPCP